ncbi:MAG TPA: ATP-binding cassette domain-containing protein [Actinomycetota bacterium]|nr:ATP-binding cassette domain-containing protein [Actinomycetota bacterium]
MTVIDRAKTPAAEETAGGIVVEDLVVEFVTDGYRIRALDALSFVAPPGQIVALLGPSGSGKTTLLSCLAGILTPASGRIVVNGRTIGSLSAAAMSEYRRTQVGIVFQAFNLIPSLSARENVAAPLLAAGTRSRTALHRADELLAIVGMGERAHHKPGQLSGGQQQRVAIARALAHDPPVLLADEPTANLDYVQAEAIVALLRDLRSQGRTILISTHDQRIVPIADAVVQMVPELEGKTGAGRVEYVAGESIFEQGTRGTLAYVIEDGQVDIIRILADGGQKHLATLGPRQYFGELAPLIGFPRSASARAKTNVVLRGYPIQEFRALMLRPGDGDTDGGKTGEKPAKPAAARRRTPAERAAKKKSASVRRVPAASRTAARTPAAKKGSPAKRSSTTRKRS